MNETQQRIGDYAIVRKIGEGGMGTVYLAECSRLCRRVALKTLRAELAAHESDRERFIREARTAAAVEHDNIVPVWQVGEAADGTPFIVMPFLQGESLDSRLKREPVAAPDFILKVARDVAAGLAAAHAKGLVHRDIKPANIWLEGDPAAADPAERVRRCKVLDFGLARSVAPGEVQLTASGVVQGTPAYMAPEQARGEKVDHRADLYGLGAVLFRMATGRLPFDAPTPLAVLIALTTDTAPASRALNPDLPPALADLIDRLLSKSPGARPPSAAEIGATVRTLLEQSAEKGPVPPAPSESLPQLLLGTDDMTDADTAPPGPRRGAPRLPLALAALAALALVPLGLWFAGAFGGKTRDGEGVRVAGAPEERPADPPAGRAAPPPAPAVPPVALPAPPVKSEPKAPEPKKPDPPQAGGERADPDRERRAALWVLAAGGTVNIDGATDEIRAAKQLPKGPFRLTGVLLTAPVKDADLAALSGCDELTLLYLVGTNITNAGLGHLKGCTNLKLLNLSGTKVDDGGAAVVERFTKLEDLSVISTGVTDRGAEGIARALPGCRIQRNGGTIEPATEADRTAAEYVLSVGGKVGVDYAEVGGAKDIKALPRGPFRLTGIDLAGSETVTNDGLSACAGCKSLAALRLSSTAIGDAGLAHFKGCANLTSLDLSGTRVGDAGAATIVRFTKLTELAVGRTRLTDKGVQGIARALPGCRIVRDGPAAPVKK